jgi:hypothetical protein
MKLIVGLKEWYSPLRRDWNVLLGGEFFHLKIQKKT